MLDLTQIAGSIGEAAISERERRARIAEETALAVAVAGMDMALWESHLPRLLASRTSWLVAHCAESPAARYGAPPVPEKHIVLATDGSQVVPDRHDGVAGCYLLNIGRVFLPYNTGQRPRLDAQAELFILDDDDDAERTAVASLGIRRYGREMAALARMIEEADAEQAPVIALTDGSLIAWTLEDDTGDDSAKSEAMEALLATFETGRSAGVPVVGYISAPGSRDVVNALRIALCPEQPVSCNRCPYLRGEKPCEPIRMATDAGVFARLLSPGERSPVFTARDQASGFSNVLRQYGEHWTSFFYLNAGAEIARIEMPLWAADDAAMIERIHAVCLDQARKGRGYPVALAEAHERAVVRGADRQAFLGMLSRAMVQAGTPAGITRKALAKRIRSL